MTRFRWVPLCGGGPLEYFPVMLSALRCRTRTYCLAAICELPVVSFSAFAFMAEFPSSTLVSDEICIWCVEDKNAFGGKIQSEMDVAPMHQT
jgi:hypothetical protein